MKPLIVFFFMVIFGFGGFAQEQETDTLRVVDPNYREDQFYISVTYNLLAQKPDNLSQSGFSSGVHLGFIRDFPINEKRNVAIGVGLGLSANGYNQNMLIATDSEGNFGYSIIDEDNITFTKNKFSTYLIEMPLEFRWRTSTATEYKFWRIYTGIRIGYVVFNSSKFKGNIGSIKHSSIDDINKLRYGLTLSAGYSTWNAHIYYGLNPIFKDTARINGESIDMASVKIGLMFYIL